MDWPTPNFTKFDDPCSPYHSARTFRLVPSRFPPIDLFEGMVDPEDMEVVFELESRTNDRLRDEIGELRLVSEEDRVAGTGCSPLMAAFTHPGQGRFTQGQYGIYWAGLDENTALAESKYARARFLADCSEPPGDVQVRLYVGRVLKSLLDVCATDYECLHHPDDYRDSWVFGGWAKQNNHWGIHYRSVRYPGGECIAGLRPPALTCPVQSKHFGYHWDGRQITHHYILTAA